MSSKNYLVIGNIHLGSSEAVLQVLSQVAKRLDATAVHLGSLITRDERAMFLRRSGLLATWDKQLKDLRKAREIADKRHRDAQDAAAAELKRLRKLPEQDAERAASKLIAELAALETQVRRLDDQIYQFAQKAATASSECKAIKAAEEARVAILKEHFPRLKIIANGKQTLTQKPSPDLQVGKYLRLSPLHPNGDKISSHPITRRALNWFSRFQSSFVVPHPTSALDSRNAIGKNNAYLYITTGGLTETVAPELETELHQAVNMPGAVLITEDRKTGEFHAARIVFRRDDKSGDLFTIVDDLLFTHNAYAALLGDDVAILTADEHGEEYSRPCLKAAVGAARGVDAHTHISAGDAWNMGSVSPWLAKNLLSREGRRLVDDLAGPAPVLQAFAHLPRREIVDSNHQHWLTKYVEERPELAGLLSWDSPFMQQFFYGYTVHQAHGGQSPSVWFGDCAIRHGHQEGTLSAAYDLYGVYACGHWHYRQEIGRCYRLPCFCDTDPAYLGGRVNGWTQGFAIAAHYNGKTLVTPKVVFSDQDSVRYCLRGEIVRLSPCET